MRLSKGMPWLLVIFASFAPAEAQISLTSDECCPCNEIGTGSGDIYIAGLPKEPEDKIVYYYKEVLSAMKTVFIHVGFNKEIIRMFEAVLSYDKPITMATVTAGFPGLISNLEFVIEKEKIEVGDKIEELKEILAWFKVLRGQMKIIQIISVHKDDLPNSIYKILIKIQMSDPTRIEDIMKLLKELETKIRKHMNQLSKTFITDITTTFEYMSYELSSPLDRVDIKVKDSKEIDSTEKVGSVSISGGGGDIRIGESSESNERNDEVNSIQVTSSSGDTIIVQDKIKEIQEIFNSVNLPAKVVKKFEHYFTKTISIEKDLPELIREMNVLIGHDNFKDSTKVKLAKILETLKLEYVRHIIEVFLDVHSRDTPRGVKDHLRSVQKLPRFTLVTSSLKELETRLWRLGLSDTVKSALLEIFRTLFYFLEPPSTTGGGIEITKKSSEETSDPDPIKKGADADSKLKYVHTTKDIITEMMAVFVDLPEEISGRFESFYTIDAGDTTKLKELIDEINAVISEKKTSLAGGTVKQLKGILERLRVTASQLYILQVWEDQQENIPWEILGQFTKMKKETDIWKLIKLILDIEDFAVKNVNNIPPSLLTSINFIVELLTSSKGSTGSITSIVKEKGTEFSVTIQESLEEIQELVQTLNLSSDVEKTFEVIFQAKDFRTLPAGIIRQITVLIQQYGSEFGHKQKERMEAILVTLVRVQRLERIQNYLLSYEGALTQKIITIIRKIQNEENVDQIIKYLKELEMAVNNLRSDIGEQAIQGLKSIFESYGYTATLLWPTASVNAYQGGEIIKLEDFVNGIKQSRESSVSFTVSRKDQCSPNIFCVLKTVSPICAYGGGYCAVDWRSDSKGITCSVKIYNCREAPTVPKLSKYEILEKLKQQQGSEISIETWVEYADDCTGGYFCGLWMQAELGFAGGFTCNIVLRDHVCTITITKKPLMIPESVTRLAYMKQEEVGLRATSAGGVLFRVNSEDECLSYCDPQTVSRYTSCPGSFQCCIKMKEYPNNYMTCHIEHQCSTNRNLRAGRLDTAVVKAKDIMEKEESINVGPIPESGSKSYNYSIVPAPIGTAVKQTPLRELGADYALTDELLPSSKRIPANRSMQKEPNEEQDKLNIVLNFHGPDHQLI